MSVTRIEVIDEKGRSYTNYKVKAHRFDYQDQGRTLKIFIEEKDDNKNIPLEKRLQENRGKSL